MAGKFYAVKKGRKPGIYIPRAANRRGHAPDAHHVARIFGLHGPYRRGQGHARLAQGGPDGDPVSYTHLIRPEREILVLTVRADRNHFRRTFHDA